MSYRSFCNLYAVMGGIQRYNRRVNSIVFSVTATVSLVKLTTLAFQHYNQFIADNFCFVT